jgi:actin-like ATPase involved in cell morphogenesis
VLVEFGKTPKKCTMKSVSLAKDSQRVQQVVRILKQNLQQVVQILKQNLQQVVQIPKQNLQQLAPGVVMEMYPRQKNSNATLLVEVGTAPKKCTMTSVSLAKDQLRVQQVGQILKQNLQVVQILKQNLQQVVQILKQNLHHLQQVAPGAVMD